MRKQIVIPSVEIKSVDKFLRLTVLESSRQGKRVPQRVMFERAVEALEREMFDEK